MWCNAPLRITASLGLMPAAFTSTRTSPAPGTGRGTSRTSRTSMPPYESNCTALDMESTPILGLRPRLKVVESDIGKFTAESGAIHRKTDAVKPFIHLDGILAHTLADHIERDLEVAKRAPDDAREYGHGFISREIVAREVETFAGESSGIFQNANGDLSDVRDSDLRERPCRRERRRVDPCRELLFYEIEVFHESNGRENRRAGADFGDVLFDLVLAVEVRNGRLPVGGADRGKDEMHASCLGCVDRRDTLSYLGVRSSEWRRHRKERSRSFERLRDPRSVFERCRN